MPDGSNFPLAGQHQSGHPPPGANMLAATRPAGGVDRLVSLVKTFTVSSIGLAVIVFGLQAIMPEGSKPSDVIGSFHGSTETAELKVKRETAADYERRLAEAKAGGAANWQMETEAFRQQQEAIAKSLAAREAAAEIADAACLGSPLATLFMGDTVQAREIQHTMQAGCAEAARIRAEMTRIQAEAARNGSALMQRNRPN